MRGLGGLLGLVVAVEVTWFCSCLNWGAIVSSVRNMGPCSFWDSHTPK